MTDHRKVLEKTARGQDEIRSVRPGKDEYLAVVRTLQEGIATHTEALALLTAEKIPGYENDPDKLVQDVFRYDLLNQLAYLMPPAIIGPFSIAGKYIKGLVQKNKKDELILSPKFLEYAKAAKGEVLERARLMGAREGVMPAVGRGCPVSYKGKNISVSGVNILCEVFQKLYFRKR